ncbi:hypothetical protein OK351_01665 [Glutamicibacter sp. MNS18]|uniref:hypothetical protein n=1 Tax=Glutamicibacter sp. MNS18 TaxID=2989817 RepID=UPI0022356D42|nr:hypothetical protein [Glutamicibacter sp. MNS18]MCW4464217.1 hypothetical protein [Glutamicibacter sp. MNS18]
MTQWLDLLQLGTPRYAAHPYQQLAGNARGAGHDGEARMILMRQRRDQLARANPGFGAKLWGELTRVTVGYGYRSSQALAWLAGLFLLTVVLIFWILPQGLATAAELQVDGTSIGCMATQRLLVGVELSFPLVSTGVHEACQIAFGSAQGEALAWVGSILKTLSWVFTTLFVAGFTGIIRRN